MIEIEEIKQKVDEEDGKLTPDLAIQILATTNKIAEDVLKKAIHGMLPKNRLGRVLNTNVIVIAGTEHNHEAQKPQKIDLTKIKA